MNEWLKKPAVINPIQELINNSFIKMEFSYYYNCFTCEYLHLTKKKEYICNYKHCKMGRTPYYPEEIPEGAIYYIGEKVCDWTPQRKAQQLLL